MEKVRRAPVRLSHLGVAALRALCAAMLVAGPLHAGDQARLTMCGYCYSDQSYESAAEQSSFNYSPAMEGVDKVYVLNPDTEDIRFFDVYRWYEPGGIDPLSTPKKAGQIRGAAYGYYHADAVAAPGDPNVEAALLEGLLAAKSFAQNMLGSVDMGDIDPGSNINSALH
ncbi:MAG: hypothetical protein HND55_10845 [Pseudomonadota bacterium]|nr:MAG: hypothetical protein HND55_10845 [Pseudomonadota bacterium]